MLRKILALTAAALLAVPPAAAHAPFDPRVRVEVDGLSPASGDVRVVASFDVQGLPPHMTARNDSASELEILDAAAKPLFRIGRTGSFGNVRSASYRNAVDPFGVLPAPATKPGTGADWRLLSREPVWRWYEDRANFHARVPAAIAATAGPVALATWRVPARLGGRPAEITGRIVWKVPRGSLRARVLGLPWAPKSVSAEALHGAIPGIQVKNQSSTVLEIAGRDGAPFARVSARGVDVNTASITWADSKGIPEPGGGEPVWKHETDLPVLIWAERRAAYEQLDPPAEVERAEAEQVLVRWELPATFGDTKVAIKGETYWQPLNASARRPATPYLAIGAAVAAGGLAVWMLRRKAGANTTAE